MARPESSISIGVETLASCGVDPNPELYSAVAIQRVVVAKERALVQAASAGSAGSRNLRVQLFGWPDF